MTGITTSVEGVSSDTAFRLDPAFIAEYKSKKPPFGFNGLGELVFRRTYSRIKEDGNNEDWTDTVARVVNGTYSMQKRWILSQHLYWNDSKAQRSAQEMFDRMWNMKFLPPGRGLWAMGSALTEERELFAALNNCGYASTDNLAEDLAEPFIFLMDASMLGIGVGFDTKGAGQVTIRAPKENVRTYEIPDTREGWVKSVELLLLSYFKPGRYTVDFDYGKVRPAGEPIKGFGGVASGPKPLQDLHDRIRKQFDGREGDLVTSRDIVDVMNFIGACVVAGNVRRTAEIAFGMPEDEDYLNLKDYRWDAGQNKYVGVAAERAEWGWTSNNSVFAELGMDYSKIADRIATNGEPGVAWLENMRAFSRMGDSPDYRDHRVKGGNPCLEQSLESYELCCLVETFPAQHDSLDDYRRTLKFAYLYAKTVTLGRTPWARTNDVLLRNRRVGTSMSGIVQAVSKLGMEEFRRWCDEGYQTVEYYDEVYSEWLKIPRSIKLTSVKPSGSVSLLAGATPGVHFPEFKTYVRRMRVSIHSDLVQPLIDAGYPVEPAVGQEETTVVVEIPVRLDGSVRTVNEVSMWEQLSLAAFMQRYWADNQVSCTVTFDPEREGHQIADALNFFQYQLKGISFLPRVEAGAYAQMPYEAISDEEYEYRVKQITLLDFGDMQEEGIGEKYCDSDVCAVEF